MRIILKKGSLEKPPKGFVGVRLTEESKGSVRFIKGKDIETLELGVGNIRK